MYRHGLSIYVHLMLRVHCSYTSLRKRTEFPLYRPLDITEHLDAFALVAPFDKVSSSEFQDSHQLSTREEQCAQIVISETNFVLHWRVVILTSCHSNNFIILIIA